MKNKSRNTQGSKPKTNVTIIKNGTPAGRAYFPSLDPESLDGSRLKELLQQFQSSKSSDTQGK